MKQRTLSHTQTHRLQEVQEVQGGYACDLLRILLVIGGVHAGVWDVNVVDLSKGREIMLGFSSVSKQDIQVDWSLFSLLCSHK